VNSIFVPSLKLGKSTGVARMYQTVISFAVKHDPYINTKYDIDDSDGLVAGIRKTAGSGPGCLGAQAHPQIIEGFGDGFARQMG